MKKLFVVDTDKNFTTQVKSLCPVNQVDMQIFSTGMQVVSLIAKEKEKPSLVLVSLDVPDVNDFVMYDLLKKTEDNSISVVVTFSNQSENHLLQFKKMKFQPKEYCQKPISKDYIHRLLKHHLELDEEDDDELSDEDIDRLVRGEYLKTDAKEKDDTNELQADTQNDFDDEVTQGEESEFEIAEILKPEENKTSRADQELRNQLISLEQQNEFLRSENKELAKKLEIQNTNLEQQNEFLRSENKELTKKLEIQNTNLIEKLKTLEKEKAELQNRLIEEREKSKSSLKNELGNLEQLYLQLKNDNDELKKREGSLNRTVSALAQEKVTLADKTKILEEEKVTLLEKLNNLEANLTSQQQEMAEKEHTHLSALENLNKELEKVLDRLHFYKNRVNELGGMLQQALELTQKENRD